MIIITPIKHYLSYTFPDCEKTKQLHHELIDDENPYNWCDCCGGGYELWRLQETKNFRWKTLQHFFLPDKSEYKEISLFTFKMVKGAYDPLLCTSRVASLDVDRLLKAQWSSNDVRIKVSVKLRPEKKDVIFFGLLNLLYQLLMEECE